MGNITDFSTFQGHLLMILTVVDMLIATCGCYHHHRRRRHHRHHHHQFYFR